MRRRRRLVVAVLLLAARAAHGQVTAAAAARPSAPLGRLFAPLDSPRSSLPGLPAASVPSSPAPSAPAAFSAPSAPLAGAPASPRASDDEFLDDLQRRAFLYFWEQTDPGTGLTKDRAVNFADDDRRLASISATGFGLSALAVADSHGWVAHDLAYARALTTLRHLRDRQVQVHGWFHHFIDAKTGEPAPGSEVSSIDTALLLAGALTAGRHFPGTEVDRLAQEIYARVDFPWMMTDGGAKPDSRTLSMGWTEKGFLPARWDAYSEHMILYMLGLGSPTHPLPADAWRAWKRPDSVLTEASGPLFTHQFSQLWLDLKDWRDDGHDYFDQSVKATVAHRDAAVAAAAEHPAYGPRCWGWTACDGPGGYKAYGAYPGHHEHDGTIAPAAAGGSAAFTPALSVDALRGMKDRYGDRIWGRYGFADAFNADAGWRSPDAVGIDQGAILLAVENARGGGVWKEFMDTDAMRRAYARAGLTKAAAAPVARSTRPESAAWSLPDGGPLLGRAARPMGYEFGGVRYIDLMNPAVVRVSNRDFMWVRAVRSGYGTTVGPVGEVGTRDYFSDTLLFELVPGRQPRFVERTLESSPDRLLEDARLSRLKVRERDARGRFTTVERLYLGVTDHSAHGGMTEKSSRNAFIPVTVDADGVPRVVRGADGAPVLVALSPGPVRGADGSWRVVDAKNGILIADAAGRPVLHARHRYAAGDPRLPAGFVPADYAEQSFLLSAAELQRGTDWTHKMARLARHETVRADALTEHYPAALRWKDSGKGLGPGAPPVRVRRRGDALFVSEGFGYPWVRAGRVAKGAVALKDGQTAFLSFDHEIRFLDIGGERKRVYTLSVKLWDAALDRLIGYYADAVQPKEVYETSNPGIPDLWHVYPTGRIVNDDGTVDTFEGAADANVVRRRWDLARLLSESGWASGPR